MKPNQKVLPESMVNNVADPSIYVLSAGTDDHAFPGLVYESTPVAVLGPLCITAIAALLIRPRPQHTESVLSERGTSPGVSLSSGCCSHNAIALHLQETMRTLSQIAIQC
jgi:hypothetical protein